MIELITLITAAAGHTFIINAGLEQTNKKIVNSSNLAFDVLELSDQSLFMIVHMNTGASPLKISAWTTFQCRTCLAVGMLLQR